MLDLRRFGHSKITGKLQKIITEKFEVNLSLCYGCLASIRVGNIFTNKKNNCRAN